MNLNHAERTEVASTEPRSKMLDKTKNTLDWLGRFNLPVALFVWPLVQFVARHVPQWWCLWLTLLSAVAAVIATGLWITSKGKPRSELRFKWMFIPLAPLIVFLGAFAYEHFHLDWTPTDEQAIQYKIATEHELRGRSIDDRIFDYYSTDARIEYDEIIDGGLVPYSFKGVGEEPAKSETSIATYYTNDRARQYLFVQHRKTFIHPPQLSVDRTAAVALTKTYFRRPEVEARGGDKELDWNTHDKCQVWVVKRVGRKWLIHRFIGNLTPDAAQERFLQELARSH